MFSFMKSFVGAKGQQIGNDIVQAIVEMDPETATQAQLEQMEQDLDKAGAVIQKLSAELEREIREYNVAKTRYDQLMGAAEVLQRKLENECSDRAGLEASLTKLVGQLEALAPEVTQEEKDVNDVRALLDTAKDAYKEKAEALTTAKANLERTKREMQRAIMQEEREGEKAARAAEVAGLRNNKSNNLNAATQAFQRRADEAKAKAAASAMKTEALTKGAPASSDANIQAALKEAAGAPAPTESLQERLARLKK